MSRHYTIQAYYLSATCPQCQAPLRLRYRRDGCGPFIGCERFPHCRFTAEYDQALQNLAVRMQVLEDEAKALRSGVRAPVHLERILTTLIFLAHPDRWHQGQPATQLAHEVTTALIDLRTQLQGG